MTTTTGKVGMLLGNSTTIGDYLFICDGTDGWVINNVGTVTAITDPDFPWNTSNYLSAEMFPDSVIALARQNNNVLVFGVYSTEFFYDAANVNGSPLARNDASTAQVGCISPNAIHQNEKQCFFIGQSDMGGRAVWQNVGFEMKKVSTEFIDRIIDSETNLADATGYGLRTMGHLFYVINLPTVNKTVVYDSEEKLWHQWSSDVSGIQNVFNCNYTADNNTGTSYLLSATGGKLYNFNVNSYQDDTTPILVELQTGKFDMDTYKRKFLVNFRIVGDETPGNYVNVKWTDDDYQTWSNIKQIGLDDSFPNFARGGAFRRRALNIQHTLNLPLRLESFETTYYEGDS